MIKIFIKNSNEKIELTEQELKQLLDEAYNEGYSAGKASNYYFVYPPYHDYPYYITTPFTVTVGDINLADSQSADYTTYTAYNNFE